MLKNPPKTKKCAICHNVFTPRNSLQKVCSIDCAKIHAERTRKRLDAKKAKEDRKILRVKKERLKTRSDWIKEVQIVFNKYIRLRDIGCDCISCDSILVPEMVGGGYDAGHYLSRGAKPHLRFDERNCHGQCKRCNRYLSGNVPNYRERLIARIGLEAVEALEADNTPRHYTIDDLKALKAHYQAKIKEMEKAG